MGRTHRASSTGARAVAVGLTVAALVTAGCTLPALVPGDGDEVAPQPGAAPVWRSCPEIARELTGRTAPGVRYDCATIAVPRDWATAGTPGGGGSPGAAPGSGGTPGGRPGTNGPTATNGPTGTTGAGGTFEIKLIRARSEEQHDRIGSLVVNPGGPGASGIDTAVYLSFGAAFGGLPDDVTDRFDIVGFDPRGVKRSSPVKCISDADLDRSFGADPDPRDADFDAVVALNKRIAERCGDRYGDQLPLFSTRQAAQDLDAVRAAVGDRTLTYLGYSYGTLLGATYAQLFPRRVRALVLDGAVDPAQDSLAGSQSQAAGFEQAFTNFTRWCADTPQRCPIAPDARAAVTEAIDKARVSPVRGRSGREATAGWIFYAVVSSLYTETGWEQLAKAVDKLGEGDPTEVFELADAYADRDGSGRYSNVFDANLAVSCADQSERPELKRIRQLRDEWRRKYPLFGPPLAIGLLSCAYWPGRADPYPTGPATGAPPVLVVGTTGDPATPYANTARLAGMLGVGQVLTWEGEGHTAYPQTGCVTKAVDAYLLDLTLPAKDLRCPAR